MATVTLKPSGYFEITMEGKTIAGRYGAKAFRMLSLMNGGLSFSQTWTLLTTGNIGNMLELMQCAIEVGSGEKLDSFDILDIVDELGGLTSDDMQKLLAHFSDGIIGDGKKKLATIETLNGQS
jgi:hypothetical protein